MPDRHAEMGWCWAGMATVAGAGLLLSDASDLLSVKEILAGFDLGTFWSLPVLGIEDVSLAFRISPMAACWSVGAGGLAGVLGWQARRRGQSLPFGWLGGGMLLSLLGVLFAANLATAFLLWSTLGLLCGWWLAWQEHDFPAVRQFFKALLIGDSLTLIGMLLAGLAWKSLDFSSFGDGAFVDQGGRLQPAWCGLSGTCLFLGLAARCGLFPFHRATRVATRLAGTSAALVWGLCLWPAALWFFLRVQPILASSPDTLFLVQGWGLLAAVLGCFLAAAEGALALAATAQVGMAMSAVAASQDALPTRLALVVGSLALAWTTWGIFNADGRRHRWAIGLAAATMAGCCPAPAFWMAGRTLSVIEDQGARADPNMTTDGERGEISERAGADAARAKAMSAATWNGGWWLWSFFAALAAWRAGKEAVAPQRGDAGEVTRPNADAVSGRLVVRISALCLLGSMGLGLWQGLKDLDADDSRPFAIAAAAALAGAALAAWVCREGAPAEERWRRLGSWTELARREFYVPVVVSAAIEAPVRAMTDLVRFVDESLIPAVARWFETSFVPGVQSSAAELRRETALFYGGSVALIVAALLVTWLLN